MLSWLDPVCPACTLKHPEHKPRRPSVCIEALREELMMTRHRLATSQYNGRRLRDLERVVRDQRQHIATLEEQLLPHLRVGIGANQEAML